MTTYIEPSRFVEWGHQVSVDYLQHNKPLNDSIAKIASENSLSPTQISRVVENANLSTDSTLAKTAEDKNGQFGIADTAQIMSILDTTPSIKTASDYNTAPTFHKSYDYNEVFGIDEVSNEHEVNEKLANISEFQEKVASAMELQNQNIENNCFEILATRDEFYKIAKQLVLRGENLMDIALEAQHALENENYRVVVAEEFKTASIKLIKDGVYGPVLQQKLAEAVSEELISDKLDFPTEPTADPRTGKVKIVNGNHPVFTTINTLVSQLSLEDAMKKSTYVLEDRANYVAVRGEDLNNSRKADKWISEETA